jgi:hypothetical protein
MIGAELDGVKQARIPMDEDVGGTATLRCAALAMKNSCPA